PFYSTIRWKVAGRVSMPIFPSWQDRLAQVQAPPVAATPACPLPRSGAFYAGRTVLVATPADAQALAELAQQRSIAWVGFDTEFRYDRPGVVLDAKHTTYDPRSIRPLLLSLALAEPDDQNGCRLYCFVVELRRPELLPAIRAVLRLPCPFV